jgi:diguanylate cyclase (GGDEF)-like protein/PAS domain S-box-containing protein
MFAPILPKPINPMFMNQSSPSSDCSGCNSPNSRYVRKAPVFVGKTQREAERRAINQLGGDFPQNVFNSSQASADVWEVQVERATQTQTSSGASGAPAADPRIAGLLELLQLTANGTMLLNTNGQVVYFGGQAAELLGLDPQQAAQRSIYEVTPSETHASIQAAFEHAGAGVTDPAFLVDTAMANGHRRSITLQLTPIIENGAVLAVMTTVMEVSSRQAANAALHGDFVSSQTMANGASLTLFHLDGRGQCTFMADSWNRATGQPLIDALGTGWLQAIPEEGRQTFRAVAGAAHQGRRGWIADLPIFRRTGQVVSSKAAASPIMDTRGATIGYIGAIHFEELPIEAAVQHHLSPATPSIAVPDLTQDDAAFAADDFLSDTHSGTSSFAPNFAAATETPDVHQHTYDQPIEQQVEPAAPQHASPGWAVSGAGAVGFSPEELAPAPKFGLRETGNSGDYTPPPLQEGFTDASLLLGTKPETVAEPEAPHEEPGVDKTTGLANKLLFAQHVQATTARMQADALTVSISFIDLHGLDLQKAAVGTRVANDYLFLLAKRLEATIRSIEIAGRIDGNILAVLSINWLFAEDLPVVARRLLNKLSEPLAGKENSELIVPMNLGMAVAAPNEDVNSLFRRAWDALQTSKARGTGEFEINVAAS